MNSRVICLACLVLTVAATLIPASVGAQTPGYLLQWGSRGSGNGQFDQPYGVATDAAGNVYVTDQGNCRIQKFTNAGTYLSQWGSRGSANGEFDWPVDVATDAAGDVYVAEFNNHRVQKFNSGGAYLAQWGTLGCGGYGQFMDPYGLATDAAGNVFVTDSYCRRIQKFTGIGSWHPNPQKASACCSEYFRGSPHEHDETSVGGETLISSIPIPASGVRTIVTHPVTVAPAWIVRTKPVTISTRVVPGRRSR